MIIINSDGGSRGNPGEGAIGIVIRRDKKIIKEHHEKLSGIVTNNFAEYSALIKALELAKKLKKVNEDILCILDSELVVKQMQGSYKVKNKNLLPLYDKAKKLSEELEKVKYKHVKREDKWQQKADELVNKALDN